MVLEHDGQIGGRGRGSEVIEDALLRRHRFLVRRDHHSVGALTLGARRQFGGGAGAAVTRAHDDGNAAIGGSHCGVDEVGAFPVRQPVRLSEDPEDRHAVDAEADHSFDHGLETADVDGFVGQERRREDGKNAAKTGHGCRPIREPGS